MNRAGFSPEMLHCLNLSETLAGNMDFTVLERQQSRLKWQEQQSQHCFFKDPNLGQTHLPSFAQSVFPASGLPDFVSGGYKLPASESDSGNLGYAERVRDSSFSEKVTVTNSPVLAKESTKKRKTEKAQQRNEFSSIPKIAAVDEMKEKRIKADTEARRDEVDSKGTEENSNNNQRESSGETAKENSKSSEVQKPDYIHVRARRGQATDSHSLAERVRREKISERMKYLQDLVPGCNKITGKAGMLDEIINYVQSLQRQVEFLSMKLATVNPRIDFNIDSFFAKEMFPACNSSLLLPELATASYIQFNPTQPLGSMLCGMDMPMNSPEIAALSRTTSIPVSVSDQFVNSSFHAHGSSSTWDPELQSLYSMEFHQGRASFPAPTFPGGNLEISNLKMEM